MSRKFSMNPDLNNGIKKDTIVKERIKIENGKIVRYKVINNQLIKVEDD